MTLRCNQSAAGSRDHPASEACGQVHQEVAAYQANLRPVRDYMNGQLMQLQRCSKDRSSLFNPQAN